jgi:hypothetical protein
MANEIYADQLLHLIRRVALESYATGVTGLERLGVRAPDLETLIGEVAASPAANTMQDRLKAIATAIGTTNGKDFATQNTLAAILAKIIAAPATEAKQDTANTTLTAIKDTAGIKKITEPITINGRNASDTQTNVVKVTDDGKLMVDAALSVESVTVEGMATETTLAALKTVIDDVYDPSNHQLKTSASVSVSEVTVNGSYSTPSHTTISVTTTSGQALASNTNRKYALLVNDSDTDMYIMLGSSAVLNQGIRINANGGSYEMSNNFGNLYTGAISVIHGGSGSKILLATEGV